MHTTVLSMDPANTVSSPCTSGGTTVQEMSDDVIPADLAVRTSLHVIDCPEPKERRILEAQGSAFEHGLPGTGTQDLLRLGWRGWLGKDMCAFFVLGIVIALPTMVVTSAANSMFSGITGLWGICMSVAAATTTFVTPLIIHRVPYDIRVLVGVLASLLSFTICVLGSSIAGPSVGTLLAGFVYAFGTNLYLAVAAFYDQRTVIAFSTGSGFSAVLGPALYIAFMQAFNNAWHYAILVFLPFPLIQLLIWGFILSPSGRRNAEHTRKIANVRDAERFAAAQRAGGGGPPASSAPSSINTSNDGNGFGPGHTRLGLFWKTILPQYVLPLLLCTCGAMFVLSGLAPTYQILNLFREAPSGALNYQLEFFMYGAAQFLFAGIAIFRTLPLIWLWALAQVLVVSLGIVQLFYPFLTYYGVWLVFMFATGGIVGGGVTNTNYKVAEDFRRKGSTDDVRAFAMSYGGLGNFAGDVLGGALAVMVQKLAENHLPVRENAGL